MSEKYDKDGLFITDKHVFFFKNRCPFSNFYCPVRFLHTYRGKTHTFFSSEQAFMWRKAISFGDDEVAKKILMEGNEDPKFCKEQGRLVKGYDDEVWDDVRGYTMKSVNFDKFSQDAILRAFILDDRFEGRTFVEASPYDKIWGIRMSVDEDDIDDENNWKGANLLGRVLDEVRRDLKNRRFVQSVEK